MSCKKYNVFAILDEDSDNSDNEKSKIIDKPEKINKSSVKLNDIKINKQSNHVKNNTNINNNNINNVNNDNDNNNVNTNKFEEEILNQFYGKKIIVNKQNKYNTNIVNSNNNFQNNNFQNNENDYVKVINKKKENKTTIECKYKNVEDNLEDIKMDNYYKVLAHHNDDKSWDYNSYYNMTCLKTWGNMATFFNTILTTKGECNYTDFDIFIMKNEISPMWEDKENRNGSICSIKIDSLTDGCKIFKNLVLHMGNNTLLKFNPSTWSTINGISFSSKKLDNTAETYCIIIKIWFKINILNYPSIDKLLNDDINEQIEKYSIKNKAIKPEY
jgi:hypothetical protein